MSTITKNQIDAILKEAARADLGPVGSNKPAAAAPASVSVAGLKATWAKVRPIVLFAIGILQMFHRGDSAAALAQFVAMLDLFASGQLPTS